MLTSFMLMVLSQPLATGLFFDPDAGAIYGAQQCHVVSTGSAGAVAAWLDWREEISAQRWFEPLASPSTAKVFRSSTGAVESLRVRGSGRLALVGQRDGGAVLLWVEPSADGGVLRAQRSDGTEYGNSLFLQAPLPTDLTAVELDSRSILWAYSAGDDVQIGTLSEVGAPPELVAIRQLGLVPGSLSLTRDQVDSTVSLTLSKDGGGFSADLRNWSPTSSIPSFATSFSLRLRALGTRVFASDRDDGGFGFGPTPSSTEWGIFSASLDTLPFLAITDSRRPVAAFKSEMFFEWRYLRGADGGAQLDAGLDGPNGSILLAERKWKRVCGLASSGGEDIWAFGSFSSEGSFVVGDQILARNLQRILPAETPKARARRPSIVASDGGFVATVSVTDTNGFAPQSMVFNGSSWVANAIPIPNSVVRPGANRSVDCWLVPRSNGSAPCVFYDMELGRSVYLQVVRELRFRNSWPGSRLVAGAPRRVIEIS